MTKKPTETPKRLKAAADPRNLALGRFIAARRHTLGLTQRDLAKRLGDFSPMIVSRYEAGQREVRFTMLLELARSLELTPQQLLHHALTGSDLDYSAQHPESVAVVAEESVAYQTQKTQQRRRTHDGTPSGDPIDASIEAVKVGHRPRHRRNPLLFGYQSVPEIDDHPLQVEWDSGAQISEAERKRRSVVFAELNLLYDLDVVGAKGVVRTMRRLLEYAVRWKRLGMVRLF